MELAWLDFFDLLTIDNEWVIPSRVQCPSPIQTIIIAPLTT
jgi:hypothetical protein